MFVTIITDASFCHTTGIAGYAYWITSDRGGAPGSGVLPIKVSSSLDAEIYSVVNAITEAYNKGFICDNDTLLIQNDCIPALTILLTSSSPQENKKHKGTAEAHYTFYRFLKAHGLTAHFKHVKGHTSEPGQRYASNRFCDTEAKAQMRFHRDDGFVPANYKPSKVPTTITTKKKANVR